VLSPKLLGTHCSVTFRLPFADTPEGSISATHKFKHIALPVDRKIAFFNSEAATAEQFVALASGAGQVTSCSDARGFCVHSLSAMDSGCPVWFPDTRKVRFPTVAEYDAAPGVYPTMHVWEVANKRVLAPVEVATQPDCLSLRCVQEAHCIDIDLTFLWNKPQLKANMDIEFHVKRSHKGWRLFFETSRYSAFTELRTWYALAVEVYVE
jgi:hypothetical protein